MIWNSPERYNFTVRKIILDAAVSEELVELKDRVKFLSSEPQAFSENVQPLSKLLHLFFLGSTKTSEGMCAKKGFVPG